MLFTYETLYYKHETLQVNFQHFTIQSQKQGDHLPQFSLILSFAHEAESFRFH